MSHYPHVMLTSLTATPIERDVVLVSGADAFSYLQTQLSQDVASLAPGRSTWSFILTPKSEIEFIIRVTRIDDTAVLDVALGQGSALRARLDGLLFRMDVAFEETSWPGVAWRGTGASDVDADAPIVDTLPWRSTEAVDVLGPDAAVPPGVPALSEEELDAIRIAEAWPAEPEIDGSVTPAMTGIVEHTVSFEKGCYTGQEFVARVRSRDATPPRRLVRIAFLVGAAVASGSEIVIESDAVGVVTSSAPTKGVGLGYLKRAVDTSEDATCADVRVMLTDTAG